MTVVGPLLVNPGRIRKEGGEERRARLALVAPRRAPPGTHTPTTFNSPDGGGVCGTSVNTTWVPNPRGTAKLPAVNRGEQD